jgi:hypothetical protein
MKTDQDTTTALEALHGSLGARAQLLSYLPFDKVEVQGQREILLATSRAILFGTKKGKGRAGRRPLV